MRFARNPAEFQRLGVVAVLLVIIIVPLCLLLLPDVRLGDVYDVNFWMTGYVGQYIRLLHHPPNVFQTTRVLGIAFPVFYGVLFFRLAGFLSALAGTDFALRCVIFGVVAAEVFAIYRAARAVSAPRGIAYLVCLSVAFSTYQLSNLYNRGDLPEFFAFGLLVTALGTFFWSRVARSSTERWLCRAIIATCLTLMAGTHAITLVLGGLTFFFAAGLTQLVDRRRAPLITIGIALAAYLIGASIATVDYVTIANQIHFVPGPYRFGFFLLVDRIDLPFARFAPFPLDPMALYRGTVREVGTPYLEAPIDYALLILTAGVLVRKREPIALTFALAAIALAIISVWPWFWDVAPPAFHFMQFPYRLTNHVNALTLCAALTVLWRLPEEVRRIAQTPLPWIAGTIAVMCVLIKLNHGATALHFVHTVETATTYESPGPFEPMSSNYTTNPQDAPGLGVHPEPPLIGMSSLGSPMPQQASANRDGVIYTRILVLPWNDISVDGRWIPEAEKLVWLNSPFYGVRAAPFSHHEIQTRFMLPALVERTIRVAEYVFLFELAVLIALFIAFARERRRITANPSRVRAARSGAA